MQLRSIFRPSSQAHEWSDCVELAYARWRRETNAAAECYRQWTSAPRSERFLAYHAYVAALEREERAARAYGRLVEPGPAA